MGATRVTRFVRAPRPAVYRALLDPQAVRQWRVPEDMTCEVHAFEPHEGGTFRVSVTYDLAAVAGKTSERTDTYHGRFAKLVPDRMVVEVIEFETEHPALRGEMTVTTTLSDADGGTRIVGVHEGLPPGVPPEDNEEGWRQALAKLAAYVEAMERK